MAKQNTKQIKEEVRSFRQVPTISGLYADWHYPEKHFRQVIYDIGGKAKGQKKNYKLECQFCGLYRERCDLSITESTHC